MLPTEIVNPNAEENAQVALTIPCLMKKLGMLEFSVVKSTTIPSGRLRPQKLALFAGIESRREFPVQHNTILFVAVERAFVPECHIRRARWRAPTATPAIPHTTLLVA